MESKLILCVGHESRNILNKIPLVGAILRDNGFLLTTEHREALTRVARASVALNHEYGEDRILVVPHHYDLKQKIDWINKHGTKNDYLLSVHLNSSRYKNANGSEVWYYGGSIASKKKAQELAKLQAKTLLLKNRGAKADITNRHGRLGIIRDTRPWAFLTELGFMSNTEDLKKIRTYGTSAIIELSKHLLDGKS